MTLYEDKEHVMKRKGTTQHTQNHSILRIVPRNALTNTTTHAPDGTATTVTSTNVHGAPGARTMPGAATCGSALIWVIAIILIILIMIGAGLTAASGRFALSATRHDQQQAYYTALSSTDTLSAWIMKGGEDAKRLLDTIPGPADTPDSIIVNTSGLPVNAGTCEVKMRFLDPEKTTLKISSTATSASASETVSLTLTRGSGGGDSEDEGNSGNTGGWPSFESNRDKTVVAKGETMTIKKSSTYGALPDIYVDGGTLIIEKDAMIKTNIYAYNGGVVDMRGSYAQTFPSETNDRVNDGIFIFGKGAFGVKINKTTISSAGKLTLPYTTTVSNGVIRDTTPGVHLVGGVWLELVNGTTSTSAQFSGRSLLCTGWDTDEFGLCPHVHGDSDISGGDGGNDGGSDSPGTGDASNDGSWITGAYGND
jgi:hypothetical protein